VRGGDVELRSKNKSEEVVGDLGVWIASCVLRKLRRKEGRGDGNGDADGYRNGNGNGEM
jgi:hypothetical protein